MVMSPGNECWVEPQTQVPYPQEYEEYRRVRETEERWPPRHRTLGPDVDPRARERVTMLAVRASAGAPSVGR